jgi:hypothetical protein
MTQNGGEANVSCKANACPNIQDNKNLGQCLICNENFHFTGAGVKKNAQFVCKTCSTAFSILTNFQETVKTLNKALLENIQQITKLQKELSEKHDECNVLKAENSMLKQKVVTVACSCGDDGKGGPNYSDPAAEAIKDHLVLTDFTLKDLDPNKLSDTTLVVLPTAKTASVTDKLLSFHGSSFKSVTHHVAANDLKDIKDEPDKIPEVIAKYKDLVQQSKAIGEQVIVSAVCPRLDDVRDLVDPFNAALQVLCEEAEVDYIDHTKSFTLGDGRFNDGYVWKSGPALTKPGVNAVARNLKLHVKPDIGDVTKDRTQSASGNHGKGNRPSSGGNRGNGNRHNNRDSSDVRINSDGCRFCNEPGHNIATCGFKQPALCTICKRRGHKAKHHTRR